MFGLALRGLASRKLRAALTALAIMLGVAMVAGTFMLKGSVDKAFDDIFAEANAGIDVTVQPKSAFDTGFDLPESGAALPESLVDKVAAVDGVEKAAGGISDSTSIAILDENGDRIGPAGGGPPQIAGSVEPEPFNPFTWVEGAAPSTPDEVGIDSITAEEEGYEVGQKITISGARGAKEYTLSGIGRFGSGVPLGGASFALFTLPEAQAITGKVGELDNIDVQAADGVSADELSSRINAVPSRRRRGEDRRRGRRPAVGRHQGRLQLPDDLPARLRRDLGLRRRVPDLQHVLDHGRPADPGVRDAADARRLLAPGPGDRLRRGADARDHRLDPRDRRRARIRRARHRRVQGDGLRAAAERDRHHRRVDRRAADRRRRLDARLLDRPGDPGDPGHAARGAARGRPGHRGAEPAPGLDRARRSSSSGSSPSSAGSSGPPRSTRPCRCSASA